MTGQTARMFLRPVGEAEIDAILEVYRQCEDFLALGPQAQATAEMVREDLRHSQQEGGVFQGIFLDTEGKPGQGCLVGVINFLLRGFEGVDEHAFLSLLMIARSYRSRGLGTEVVGRIEVEIARDAAVWAIFLGVQVNNPAALRFWERLGYQVISGPRPQPDTTISLLLRKIL